MSLSGLELIFAVNTLQSGGAEKQMLLIARMLAEEGMNCRVLELRHGRETERITALIQAAERAGVVFSRAKPGDAWWEGWRRLGAMMRDHPRAIVWTWGYRTDALVLAWQALIKNRRWISSLRSANEKKIRQMWWLRWLGRKKISRFVSNTWANCEMVERANPGLLARCRVLYNMMKEDDSAPIEHPACCPSSLRILMLGNLQIAVKGYDLVLALAARIQAENLPVEIHVAGRPDNLHWLKRIKEQRLEAVVFYHGETGRPLEFLRSGHAFLLFSRLEGMPNALLEAMSLGLPAIATKVGDLARLTRDGEELRLINIGDVDGALRAVKELLADWPTAVAMGARGREWCARNFAPDVIRARCVEIIRELAEATTCGN